MVFSSTIFIFGFLPLIVFFHTISYLFFNKKGLNLVWLNLLLFLSSISFYAWGELTYIYILLFCTLYTFLFGLFIEKNGSRRRFFLWLGVGGNLLILVYFKYAMLIVIPNITLINHLLPISFELDAALQIALPLGISFYIFQAISYLIDVSRGDVRASKSFINFACYLTMFPQLVAGPIVRYKLIRHELTERCLTLTGFSSGVSLFIWGLAKKVLIADTLGRVADAAFMVPDGYLSAFGAWVGIFCFTMQIYYDFSGYSDMAIGMGRIFGFSFPQNFNYPYIARSIRGFWQRWHMTLSNWFRDYLYISLGGSRKSKAITYRNLLLVFLLCGLWHGASWTFMAWGAYHGFFLILERSFPEIVDKLPRVFRHLYVMLIVSLGWVLFKAESFHHALYYYQAMLGLFEGGVEMNQLWLVLYGMDVGIALVLAIIFSCPIIPWLADTISNSFLFQYPSIRISCEGIYYLAMIGILFVTFMPILGSGYTAFIYFRF